MEELYTMLNSIQGFSGKVAYRAFPIGEAPELPFICYLATNSNNFVADNKVYHKIQEVDIELYTRNKDITSETLVEDALDANGIVWEKYEEFIDSENCFQITYTINKEM